MEKVPLVCVGSVGGVTDICVLTFQTLFAVLVVFLSLFRIREYLIGDGDLLESVLVAASVRVVLQGQLAEALLELRITKSKRVFINGSIKKKKKRIARFVF